LYANDPPLRVWGNVMVAKQMRETASKMPGGDLMRRLQGLLYEYHDMGCFEEARPHILWLMEIAESQDHSAGLANRLV
jgi:hypothetical protein